MNFRDLLTFHNLTVLSSLAMLLYGIFSQEKRNPVSAQNDATRRHKMILLAALVIALGWRTTNLSGVELDVDTSTWLSAAISIGHYPDKLWKLLNYTDSRPLTVLPLYLLSLAGLPLRYETSELTGVVFWLVSLYLTYRSLTWYLPSYQSLLLVLSMSLFIASSRFPHINAYNSEAVSVLMLSGCSYAYLHLSASRYRSWPLLLFTGLTLGGLVFAKFQNVPMGLVIAGFIIYGLIREQAWTRLSAFAVAGMLPVLFVNLIFLLYGKLHEFWLNYFWNYFEYSFTTQFQKTPLRERFYPRRIASLILSPQASRVFFTGTGLVITAGFFYLLFRKKLSVYFTHRLHLFAFLMGAAGFYAVVQSGNLFPHYLLYLLLPVLWVIASLTPYVHARLPRWATACMAVQVLLNIFLSAHPYPQEPLAEKALVREIKANSTPRDNIIVWSWIDRLYVLSRRAAGHRMPHMHQLFLDSDLLPYRIDRFLNDLETNKPALFLEDLRGRHGPLPEIHKPVSAFPAVRTYLQTHYILLSTVDHIAVYGRKRKELRAAE